MDKNKKNKVSVNLLFSNNNFYILNNDVYPILIDDLKIE